MKFADGGNLATRIILGAIMAIVGVGGTVHLIWGVASPAEKISAVGVMLAVEIAGVYLWRRMPWIGGSR